MVVVVVRVADVRIGLTRAGAPRMFCNVRGTLYGIAGYTAAVATAYLRMYNNKHWFSDVVAGAGVGIISTKLAYWLYPRIQHRFCKDKPAKTVFLPNYNNGAWGLGMVHNF